jgi:hypothetical protein
MVIGPEADELVDAGAHPASAHSPAARAVTVANGASARDVAPRPVLGRLDGVRKNLIPSSLDDFVVVGGALDEYSPAGIPKQVSRRYHHAQ